MAADGLELVPTPTPTSTPTPTPADLTDEAIDAYDEANPNKPLAIFACVHNRRRRRAHAIAKSTQIALGVKDKSHAPELLARLTAAFRAPLLPSEADMGGMDYLLQTVQDCIDAGDLEDTLHAMVRVVRKEYAWNRHLDPIEGGK